MAQEYIKMNGTLIRQPDEGLSYGFETTYTNGSTRTQDGKGHFSGMFTVESYGYAATDVTMAEMKQILQIIAKGEKFIFHHFSPYQGKWCDGEFYVGQGDLTIGRLNERGEVFDSLAFHAIGVDPI